MADIDFDTAQARADGVPDSAIAEFLASKVGFDLAAARADKVPDSAIVNFLAPPKAPPVAAPTPAPAPEGPKSSLLGGIGKVAAQTLPKAEGRLVHGFGRMVESAGTAIEGAPVARQQLDVMDRIDRGEEVKPADDPLGYADADPDQRKAIRQDILNAIASPTTAQVGASAKRVGGEIAAAGTKIEAAAEKWHPMTEEEKGRFSVKTAEILGGLATYVGAASLTGLGGIASMAGVESFGQTYDEAKAKGASDEAAAKAALANGLIQGGLNVVPVHRAMAALDALPQAMRGEVLNAAYQMAASSGTLLAVSQFSRLVDNAVAKNSYDPDRSLTDGLGEHLAETAVAGAIPGLPGVAIAAARRPRVSTPEAAGREVMQASSVDDAIAKAREIVDRPALEEHAAQAQEFGNRGEQDQAAILRLFGGLNEGQVERAPDGAWHYRDARGASVQLREWNGRQRDDTIPSAMVEAQRRHYEQLGVRVVYFEDDARIPFDGAVDPAQPNTIFLSNKPQRNAAQVGAHEFTHVLEDTRLPDGTSLADILHQQVAAGMTAEGRAYAEQLFGREAPKREAFAEGAEGDLLHADAVTRHFIRELSADIGAEAPKFQTFLPRVIDAVESRFGAAAARDALDRLIAGIRQAMATLRNFFSKPEDMAEYGQPPTESQKWVSNLEQIHDTLAKMYAERYGRDLQLQPVGPQPSPVPPYQRRLEAPSLVTPPPRPAVTPENVFQPETYGRRLADLTPEPARVDRVPAEPMGPSVAAARERLEATPTAEGGMGRRDMNLDRNQRMADAWARWEVMHEEVGEPEIRRIVEDSGASPDHLDEISRYYDRKEGETPRQAFERAVSRWVDKAEADAVREFNLIDTELEAPRGEKPASQPTAEDRVEAARPGEAGGGPSGREAGGGREPAREADRPAAAAESAAARVEPEPTPVQKERAKLAEMKAKAREGKSAPAAEPSLSAAQYESVGKLSTVDDVLSPTPVAKGKIGSKRAFIVDPEGRLIDVSDVGHPEANARLNEMAGYSRDDEAGIFYTGKSPIVRVDATYYAPSDQLSIGINAYEAGVTPAQKRTIDALQRRVRADQRKGQNVEVVGEVSDGYGGNPVSDLASVKVRGAFETQLQKEQAKLNAMREKARAAKEKPAAETKVEPEPEPKPTPEEVPVEEVKPQPRAEPVAEPAPKAETPPAKPKAAPSRMIEDAGEKIGGARKDLWAERGMRLSDLEGMTEGEAYQHVTKDAVWPKPDYAKMVEGGMSPEAAALVKIIRDRLSTRPSNDSPEGRRAFVKMMGFVREAYADVKTKADFRAARDRLFYELAGWPRDRSSLSAAKEAKDVVFSVYKGRSEPFRVGHADERKAQQMVEEGFPAKAEPWTRRYEVRQWGTDKFAVVAKGTRRTVDGQSFPTREEAEAHARTTYENAQSSGAEAPLPSRPHLDSVQRTGADIRGGKDVGSQNFVDDFGFRGVEFGNWVASDERAKVVNLAYDALHDMAGILGISPKALSLDGQLGLAFGARGSGRAAAHYEPGRLVINMTKLSGAGSLAHEWGHALDHYFGTLDTPANTRGAPKGASGWYDRTEQRVSYLKNLRPEMAEAFDRLMTAIFKREKPKAEAVRDTELRIERYQADIDRMKERMAASTDETSFKKAAQRYIEQTQLQLEAAGKRLADLRDETKPYTGQKINSSYYDEANKLSGKSGEKGYWSRPTEMFARAFESYVFDKIKAEGKESQYLVQGVEPERYASGYKGNPYPAAERPAINAAFDHLFDVMKEREGAKGPVLFSPRRIMGENLDRKYTPEQEAAFKRVGRATEPTTLRDKIDEARDDIGRKAIAATMDSYIGLKRNDPEGYMAARLANSVAGAQEVFRLYGTLKFDGATYNYKDLNGGVRGFIRSLGPEAHDFLWWVAANRAERLKAEDRENLFSNADIKALKELNRGELDFSYQMPNGTVTRRREAAYVDALRRYDALNKSVLDLVKESGLVKGDVVDQLWADPFYVPFYREAADQGSTRFTAPTSGMVKQYATKKLKGGSEQLRKDLWENAFGNWDHMIDAALRNRAAVQVLRTTERMGGAVEIPAAVYENKLTNAEKMQTTWAMVDGKKTYWRVEDPMVFKAVAALESAGTPGPIQNVARWFARALRYGVTANPLFAVRNLIRDTENSIAVSQVSKNPFKNLADGFAQVDTRDRLANLWRAVKGHELEAVGLEPEAISAMAGGGLMRLGTLEDAGIPKTDLRNVLDTPNKLQAFGRYFKDVAGAYKEALASGEDVNRLALYKQLREQGASHDFASFSARDLQDFTLRGASPFVKTVTDITPFLNARLQGLYKLGRSASDADRSVAAAVGGRVARNLAMRTAAVLGAMTLASLALDAIYQDDQDYRKRTEFDRQTYYWFKIGDAQFRIPKGFELAALSSLAADGIETFFSKEMTGERWANNFWTALGTNLQVQAPAVAQPVLDIATNTRGTGGPIETMGMERLEPQERYTADTTLIARGLSSAINAGLRSVAPRADGPSPVQIDYLVNAYGAWLGTQIMALADTVVRAASDVPERPDKDFWTQATQGLIRTDPAPQSRYVDMLYSQGKQIEQAHATFLSLVKMGRGQEAKEFAQDRRDILLKYPAFERVKALEGDINRQIRLVENDRGLSGEQKRVKIMRLSALKNQVAENLFTRGISP